MKTRIILLIICFLVSLMGCFYGCKSEIALSKEQGLNYPELAIYYEEQAVEVQEMSDCYWDCYESAYPWEISAERDKATAKYFEVLAKEYRQQANHYRELASRK